MMSLSAESVAALRGRVEGAVVTPADAEYDASRMAWNLSVQQRPALIVAAASEQDVIESVRYARDNGLGVAVQATGHGVARPADDALLILTRGLKGLSIDPVAQTARIEAGVKWGPVLEMAQTHGLAPLLGSSPDVGAVGYTLGGGKGWLARKYGLAVDSVLSFDVVTPRGEAFVVNALEHPDLFWALLGGGGANYAIVTAMEIRLFPVRQVYGGNLMYPATQARAVFQRYRDWIADLPDEMSSSVVLMNYPPFPEVPDAVRGQSFAIVRGCYAGNLDEARMLVNSWRKWQTPSLDAFGTMSFSAAASISQDPEGPIPGYSTGAMLNDLSDEVIDTILARSLPKGGPPPVVKAEVLQMGGAIARGRPDDMAASHRDYPLMVNLVSVTPNPEAYAAARDNAAAMWSALGAHVASDANYPNFLDGTDQLERVNSLFTSDKHSRLQAVKAAYDPDNLLRYGFGVPG